MEIPGAFYEQHCTWRQRLKKIITFAFLLRVNITEIHHIIALGNVYTETKMRFSRMPTARSLTVSRSIRCGGGGSAQPPWMQTPVGRMTNACEILTFANFVCGR